MTSSRPHSTARLIALTSLAGFSALAVLAASAALAASTRATVATTKGETIEGDFKGATETDVAIAVAGQIIRLPLGTIKYISFVGQLGALPASGAGQKAGSLDDALAALGEIQTAVEVGILREQYSEKLQQTLPRVLQFLKSVDKDWHPDAQVALKRAVEAYQAPLGSISSGSLWPYAANHWRIAQSEINYGQLVIKDDPPPGHRENPTQTALVLGTKVKGRIGVGDATPPASLLDSSVRGVSPLPTSTRSQSAPRPNRFLHD